LHRIYATCDVENIEVNSRFFRV